MTKTLVIGIAGGTGSGKSTLADSLSERFGDAVTVLRHDDYYKEQVGRTYEQRAAVNYDCPEAYETDLLIRHLRELKAGRAVDCPVYDFTQHNRSGRVRRVEPTPVILLDGILIFAEPSLRELLDVKIFVDTDADIRLMRRIERDAVERGRSLASVLTQYRDTVRPMHERYVQPSLQYADVVLQGSRQNPAAVALIGAAIERHLSVCETE